MRDNYDLTDSEREKVFEESERVFEDRERVFEDSEEGSVRCKEE